MITSTEQYTYIAVMALQICYLLPYDGIHEREFEFRLLLLKWLKGGIQLRAQGLQTLV